MPIFNIFVGLTPIISYTPVKLKRKVIPSWNLNKKVHVTYVRKEGGDYRLGGETTCMDGMPKYLAKPLFDQ